jgi:hypothetical protein
MAARSHQARRQRLSMRTDLPAYSESIPQHCDDYVGQRLLRVRVLLNRIDEMMSKEEDPQKIDRLGSAQARLAEQERILFGRPLPGSKRPANERLALRALPPPE